MRPLLVILLCVLSVSSLRAERFLFSAMGCLPYDRVSGSDEKILALRDEIARRGHAFTVHCGDINAGNDRADDARFQRIRDWFDSFEAPLIYTPGDNEWTDAHRPAIGAFEPTERLARIREFFFAEPVSRGRVTLPLTTQAATAGFEKFVENVAWVRSGVRFISVHVVGSNNNNQPAIPGAVDQFRERDAANLAWLRAQFELARAENALGLVVFMQAQPFAWTWGQEGFMSGFERFLLAFEEETLAFGRPVLLVHADEHVYRLEYNVAVATGRPALPNLIRLGTFGDADIHAVEVLVDPESPRLFAPGPLIVPSNGIPGLRK